MFRSVDFDDVIKDFALAKSSNGVFELCTALQLQMHAKYALDWYLSKNSF